MSANAETLLQRIFAKIRKADNGAELQSFWKYATVSEASYEYAAEYAAAMAEATGRALLDELQPDLFPDGIPDQESKAILPPALQRLQARISDYCDATQRSLNRRAGLGLAPVRPALNRSRVDGFVSKSASYASMDETSWLFEEPLVNFALSVVDDFVRVNVRLHAAAGLHPLVMRVNAEPECPFCAELAGVYPWPFGPKATQRHAGCRCFLLYDPSDAKADDAKRRAMYAKTQKDERQDRISRILSATVRAQWPTIF